MNNDSARGYVIIAMKNLGYEGEAIEKVIDELHYVFDTITEAEAEKLYNNPFKYEKNPNKYDNIDLEEENK